MDVQLWGFEVTIDEDRLAGSPASVREQVREYARGERERFDVDVRVPDSFTGRVMRAIDEIPYGETRTYGDLAAEIGTSPVAVGQGCGSNPVPLVVPCHRVVGADSQGGFSAGGERSHDLKRALLDHEGAAIDGGRSSDQTTLADHHQ